MSETPETDASLFVFLAQWARAADADGEDDAARLFRKCERRLREAEDEVRWNRAAAVEACKMSARLLQRAEAAERRPSGEDTKRLEWLETLNGRRYCHPRGKIWPLSTDIHINKSFAIYLRNELGNIACQGDGSTMREAIDKAILDLSTVGRKERAE